MAPRALIIPVLIDSRPMQRVTSNKFAIRVERVPALASLFFRAGIPSYSDCLHAPARKLDQVLLERCDAKGVADLKIGQSSIGPIRVDPELAISFEERAYDPV